MSKRNRRWVSNDPGIHWLWKLADGLMMLAVRLVVAVVKLAAAVVRCVLSRRRPDALTAD